MSMAEGHRGRDAAEAWDASRAAVRLILGAEPPITPGVKRGGRRSDRAAAWRRQVAIYTAAVGLNAGVKPLIQHVGVSRYTVRKILIDLEDRRDVQAIDLLLELVRAEAERQLARKMRQGVVA